MKGFAVMFICGMLATSALANPAAVSAINEMRTKGGLAPVDYSSKLERAAKAHARDMERKGFFDHKGSNGSTVGKRASKAGYRWCYIAENIAKGQKDLATVMEAWRTSSGHYANIMKRDISEIGMAEAKGKIWVLVLGARSC